MANLHLVSNELVRAVFQGSKSYDKNWNWSGFLLFIIISCLFYFNCRKPKNYPNGPRWYPIVGSALTLQNQRSQLGMLWRAIDKLALKYDPARKGIIGFKVGKDRIVFVYTSDSIKEMMANEDFDGRPKGPFYETRTWNMRRGLLLTDEDFWIEQRRFIVRHLKQFGFARRGMVDLIQNEAEFIFEDVKTIINENGGQVLVKMNDLFASYVLNTLWYMMAGKRFSRENIQLKELQQILRDLFASIDMMGAQFSHFPILRYIAPQLSGYNQFINIHQMMHNFIQKEVSSHKRNYKESNEPNDLMDAYLKALSSPNQSYTFSEKQLLAICLDMFIAGSETTNKTMGFALLYLLREPNIQRKMQNEIDSIVGRERLPKLEDRINMPFCEAVVLESVRLFMTHTFGIPHRALKNTVLCGFDIPKDTMVVSAFFGMTQDLAVYKDAKKFNPDHFLSNGKVSIPDQYAPFGIGKRRCMGEGMAKSNLFLFLTTLMQNFTLELPKGTPLPSDEPVDGATPSVRNFSALIKCR